MGLGHFLRNPEELEHFNTIVGQMWLAGKRDIRVEIVTGTRTPAQQAAIEVYCRLLGEALNEAGYDLLTFPWREGVEIPWSQSLVKDRLWKPLQDAMLDIPTTTKLDTKQVNEVYEVLDRKISQSCGIHVPFPSNQP